MAERLVWTPADGSPRVDFTDEAGGYVWQAEGTRGLRSVVYSFTSQTYAGIDGDHVQNVRADANHPSIGMLVRARNAAEFRTRSRGLVHAMRPKAGAGTLTVTTEDGESRRLLCYYESGAEGDESDDTTMPGRWWKLILRLYAPMPWWLGDPVRVEFGLGAPTAFFPFFPLVLSPSSIQGEFTVDLSGTDSPAYPVWTVTGPGSHLVLTNETTGRSIEIAAALAPGESMQIDTRPGQRAVRRLEVGTGGELVPGELLTGALQGDPSLWPLVDGVNRVTAALTGATAASRITGTYEPRYAGV